MSNRKAGFQNPGITPSTSITTGRSGLLMQVRDILKSGRKDNTSPTLNASRFRLKPSSHSHDSTIGTTSQSSYQPRKLLSTLGAPPLTAATNPTRKDDTASLFDDLLHLDLDESSSSDDDDSQGENSYDESSEGDDDSDQEDSSTDDTSESDDDDLDNYMDPSTAMNIRLNASSIESKLSLLRERFPNIARGVLLQALHDNNSHYTKAMLQLCNTNSSPKTALPNHPAKRTNGQSTKKRKMESDSDGEPDGYQQRRPKTMHWKERQELMQSAQAVSFFNTATPQELMDVTGCNLTRADKLISLRPFGHLEELTHKLKTQKGLSVAWVRIYMEMMQGYTAVDQIIQSIEQTGKELGSILDIWGSASTTLNDDDEAGVHITEVNVNGLDTSNVVYKDAMDGFLMEQPAIMNPELTLKPYQLLGVNWLLLLYRKNISGILADEMGLGKTAQVISFLGRLKELGKSGLHMVVVPASTLDNWMIEFERFCPSLNVYCYHGSQNERAEIQTDILKKRNAIDVVVTTYSLASGAADDRHFLKKLKCKTLILDEGHMIKNYTSARYGHLMQLKIPFRLLLTGTPLQNNLLELVSLLIFIMPNIFTGNEDEVRKIFKLSVSKTGTPKGSSHDTHTKVTQMLSRNRVDRAKKMMTPFILRRRKAQVLLHLPKKIHHVEHCTMTPHQQAVYTDLVAAYKGQYDTLGGKKGSMAYQSVIMKLRMAADHPLLFRYIYTDETIKTMAKEIMKEKCFADSLEEYIYEDMEVMSDFELDLLCKRYKSVGHHKLCNEEWMDAGKVRFLQQLLPETKRKGDKALIFSQFTLMLDILEPVMDTLGISFIRLDGTTKVDERQDLIDKFNKDPSISVFLISTKAGGFGINLASANVVVMYDMDFNPQNDKQAEDRAHRVGQTRDVDVYKLVSEHTIEHQILEMANVRLRLDSTISGNVDDKGISQDTMKHMLKSALQPSV